MLFCFAKNDKPDFAVHQKTNFAAKDEMIKQPPPSMI
jgi:hypothetical protein